MGRQIQIRLSNYAEQRLIDHLVSKFPHCKIVDSVYRPGWDRHALYRTDDTRRWLIIDERTERILIRSAAQTDSGDWQIRSRAFSCIEWSRDLQIPGERRGRLYLSTDPDPIWLATSAESGDAIENMFKSAQSWVRRHCRKATDGRHPIWADE